MTKTFQWLCARLQSLQFCSKPSICCSKMIACNILKIYLHICWWGSNSLSVICGFHEKLMISDSSNGHYIKKQCSQTSLIHCCIDKCQWAPLVLMKLNGYHFIDIMSFCVKSVAFYKKKAHSSLHFPVNLSDDLSPLVLVMAWCQVGIKPLCEPGNDWDPLCRMISLGCKIYLGWNKMADILQRTFSNACYWKKILVSWFKIY